MPGGKQRGWDIYIVVNWEIGVVVREEAALYRPPSHLSDSCFMPGPLLRLQSVLVAQVRSIVSFLGWFISFLSCYNFSLSILSISAREVQMRHHPYFSDSLCEKRLIISWWYPIGSIGRGSIDWPCRQPIGKHWMPCSIYCGGSESIGKLGLHDV